MEAIVIGAGNWGTAFSLYLDRLGIKTTLYEFFEEKAKRIKEKRENEIFLPGYNIPESIEITSDIDLIRNKEFIIIALPSHTIDNITKMLSKYFNKNQIIVSLSKGIEPRTLRRVSQIIEDNLKTKNIVALSGPSIAREFVKGTPTSLVAASRKIDIAKKVQKCFSSETLRIYTSNDIIGVELGGSLKNVYAIAAGVIDGLGFGLNTKAALITRSLAEMKRLGTAMGGKTDTFNGLSGTGDLIVTAFSDFSRNHYVGRELGKGKKIENILKDMKEVAEGVNTSLSVRKLSHKYKVELPIAEEVYKVIFENESPEVSIRRLMKRALKGED
uniref:Glycerol-3-phosphate dehydrogenase [NAD(P)+] n=1 Tax=candidate division WOR-3 bacterium TaxID=2052148 RepID=A0A7C4YBU1_UNCW3